MRNLRVSVLSKDINQWGAQDNQLSLPLTHCIKIFKADLKAIQNFEDCKNEQHRLTLGK